MAGHDRGIVAYAFYNEIAQQGNTEGHQQSQYSTFIHVVILRFKGQGTRFKIVGT
jgi:hypothetical protein